jgi:hypothetical protein
MNCINYGVTSAVQSMREPLTDKIRGAGQQNAHMASTVS